MNREDRTGQAAKAVTALAYGNEEAAAEHMTAALAGATIADAYDVCCYLAFMIAKSVRLVGGHDDDDEESMIAVQYIGDGDMADDPSTAFAFRFFAAYGNGDTDTCRALFATVVEAGEDASIAAISKLALLATEWSTRAVAFLSERDSR